MTVSELIAELRTFDPSARILTRWEGELREVNIADGDITPISAHAPEFSAGYPSEHEEETGDDDGRCFRCVEDKPARWVYFKAVVIG